MVGGLRNASRWVMRWHYSAMLSLPSEGLSYARHVVRTVIGVKRRGGPASTGSPRPGDHSGGSRAPVDRPPTVGLARAHRSRRRRHRLPTARRGAYRLDLMGRGIGPATP